MKTVTLVLLVIGLVAFVSGLADVFRLRKRIGPPATRRQFFTAVLWVQSYPLVALNAPGLGVSWVRWAWKNSSTNGCTLSRTDTSVRVVH